MEPNRLMVVAHPDDELLWGGANLLSSHGWHVVVSTHKNTRRSIEFYKTMSILGVVSCEIFDVKDKYTEKMAVARKLYTNTDFEKRLKELAAKKWDVVVTHNANGEYGHAHHKTVHLMMVEAFGKRRIMCFSDKGPHINQSILDLKSEASMFYSKTQTIAKVLESCDLKELKIVEREHITMEIIYKPQKHVEFIPKIIHQIWFGDQAPPPWRKYLFDTNARVAASQNILHKMWTMDDLNAVNFPLTWKAIQKAISTGKRKNVSRWAQVADLARYEIIYRYGGVYCDALFELTPRFWRMINKENKNGALMVCANEDPCGFDCFGKIERYISNGFFASTPRHIVLKRLLSRAEKCDINFNSKYVNFTTGPYFFRSGIIDPIKERVSLLDSFKIYPVIVNDSDYRDGEKNKCIVKSSKNAIKVNEDTFLLKDCTSKKYKKAASVYHSGLGGSWSW